MNRKLLILYWAGFAGLLFACPWFVTLLGLPLVFFSAYIVNKTLKAADALAEANKNLKSKVSEGVEVISTQQRVLQQSSKMVVLGEMAGSIAHEINTPLSVITLNTDVLFEMFYSGKINKDRLDRSIATIQKTTQRIAKIIHGLRGFSRDGSNDPMQLMSVNQIVEDTISLCQEKIKIGGIELMIDVPPKELFVECRPAEISQVLLNLVGNAHDAILNNKEKWIRLSCALVDERIEILITDSGSGISSEVQQKLFQPFFTTKEVGKGTGLGLSISMGIMETHGGELKYDPKCDNTRFVVALPVPKSCEGRLVA